MVGDVGGAAAVCEIMDWSVSTLERRLRDPDPARRFPSPFRDGPRSPRKWSLDEARAHRDNLPRVEYEPKKEPVG